MKTLTHISRFLLGLIFFVFGLNGFLHFIPMPPPSGVAGQFLGAMFVSKYLLVVSGLQVISGALLLINRYVPLALTILGPIIVNILKLISLSKPLPSRTSNSYRRALNVLVAAQVTQFRSDVQPFVRPNWSLKLIAASSCA